jgi:hypothetical protein
MQACELRRPQNYLYLYLLLPGDHEVSCIIKQKGIKCQRALTNESHNYPITEECSKTNVMSHTVNMTEKKTQEG